MSPCGGGSPPRHFQKGCYLTRTLASPQIPVNIDLAITFVTRCAIEGMTQNSIVEILRITLYSRSRDSHTFKQRN
jgi:hypothetical protein